MGLTRSIRVMAAILCLAATAAAAAEKIEDFGFAVPIEGLGGDALNRVAIPQAVYEGAAFADLRDLRVFNGAGEPVGFAFRPLETATEKQAPVRLPIFPLRGPANAQPDDLDLSLDRRGGRVSVRVRTREGKPAKPALLGYLVDASSLKVPVRRIDIDWGSAKVDFLTPARLEASDDLRHWNSLESGVPLGALAHTGQRLERKTVEFHPTKAKYLRLLWSDPSLGFEIRGVQVQPPEKMAPPERLWKEVTASAGAAPGEYEFDLGGRFPVERLVLVLPQENTIVPVQVHSRAKAEDKWMPVAGAVAYRLNQNGRELTSPEIPVAPNAHRYWKVVVNMASGGIGGGVLRVRAGWTPRELVFIARGAGPFRVAYGNAQAQATALAVGTLVPGWRTEEEPAMKAAATGAPQTLAGASAARTRPDLKRWALWAALLGGVGVLAWMALRLSKQLQQADGS